MKILCYLCLLIPSFAVAQVYETVEDIYFEKIISIENRTKDELFLAAKEWLAETTWMGKDLIGFEDRSNGKIVAYGNEAINVKIENAVKILGAVTKKKINTNNRLLFVLKIYCQDNRTKFSLIRTKVALLNRGVIEKQAPLTKFYFNKNGVPRTKTKELKREINAIFNRVALDYEQSLKKNRKFGDW